MDLFKGKADRIRDWFYSDTPTEGDIDFILSIFREIYAQGLEDAAKIADRSSSPIDNVGRSANAIAASIRNVIPKEDA